MRKVTAMFFLIGLFTFSIFCSVFASELNNVSISVQFDNMTYSEIIQNDNHYIFLPSNIKDITSATVFYTGTIVNVSKTDIILDSDRNQLVFDEYHDPSSLEIEFTIDTEEKNNIRYYFMKSDLPCISVSLNDITLDEINEGSKEIVYPGNTVTITDPANEMNNISFDNVEMKGRGNSTWTYEKKPYQFKLSSKQSVLGMGKAKKWLLIANYMDSTLMRNSLTLDLTKDMRMPYTVQYRFVDLFVDNVYQGNYLLCEKVEVGSSRVNLKSQDGIVVELDDIYGRKEKYYFKVGNQVYVLNDSKADDLDMTESIALESFHKFEEYIKELDSLIHAEHKDWDKISHMIDVESFVKIYFIQEFSVELDSCLTSFYMYKDGYDDVLHLGPVWDYDKAYNGAGATFVPTNDYLPKLQSYFTPKGSDWYPQLCKIPEFNNLLNEYYSKEIGSVLETTPDKIDNYRQKIYHSWDMNAIIWPKRFKQGTFDSKVNALKKWTNQRLAYFAERYAYEEEDEKEIISSFEFELGDVLDKTELKQQIFATSGLISENSILTASLDGSEMKNLKYSGNNSAESADLFSDNESSGTYPVLTAKSQKENSAPEPWTENSCFIIQASTVSYENISLNASIGATNKAAKDYKLQYSIDGEHYIDIPESYVSLNSAKVFEHVYNRFKLPAECQDQDVIYLKILLASNTSVNGKKIKFGVDTSGAIAINHIALMGDKIIHNLNYVSEEDAMCLTEGHIEYWQCSDCNQYFTNENATHRVSREDIRIEAKDHKFVIYTSNEDATCLEDGTETAKCENCISENTILALGSKLGHDWDDGKLTKAATYEATGTKVYKCSRCDEARLEVVPKLTNSEQDSKEDNDNKIEPGKKNNKNDDKKADDQKIKKDKETTDNQSSIEFVDKKSNATYRVLNTTDGSKQVVYVRSNQRKAKSVKIPNEISISGQRYSVTQIEANAFRKNRNLTSVTIGKNVEVIKESAFENCSKLEKVKFSSGQKLITIKAKAFMNCRSLKKIVIPKTVTTIGTKAFYNCAKLKRVAISGGRINKVGSSAFRNMAPKSIIKVKKKMFTSYKKIFSKKYTASKTIMNIY